MKIGAAIILAFVILVVVARAGEGPANRKPQGMTLRLELFVTDIDKSIDFYTNVLGFERMKGEPTYVPVRSGSAIIGLGPAAGLPKQHHFNPEVQKARRGLGTEIALEVDDVQGLFEKVASSGYKRILSPLRKQSWGLTNFRIADPDGYYLRITSR
jgi:catechol 2,3-dioxygenase-like lactoylglutathione lyase family enzyme